MIRRIILMSAVGAGRDRAVLAASSQMYETEIGGL